MKLGDLKKKLSSKIEKSLVCHLAEIEKCFGSEKFFSYVVYTSSGCRDIGAALCSSQYLLSKNIEEREYIKLNAAEWDHVNEYYSCFRSVDEEINSIYEVFYEGELDDIDLDSMDSDQLWEFISQFFSESIIDAFLKLKNNKFFDKEYFESDLLLGLQFSDPDENSVPMIENVSSVLNSKFWHEKVVSSCKAIAGNF